MAEPAKDASNQATDPLIEALRALLGERLSTSQAVREHHGKDSSYHAMEAPDAVAFAETRQWDDLCQKLFHSIEGIATSHKKTREQHE